LRINRIIYAVKVFNLQIANIEDFIFVSITVAQDFFFCFLIYFLIRAITGISKNKIVFALTSAVSVIFYLLIFLFNAADYIYFKNSGASISWNSMLLVKGNILNLWDSALVYLTPSLSVSIIFCAILIGVSGYIGIYFFNEFKDDFSFKDFYITKKIALIVMVISLFLFSQNYLISLGSKTHINSIPVFNVVSSYIADKIENNRSAKTEKGVIKKPKTIKKFNADSKIFPISINDRKTIEVITSNLNSLNKNFNIIYYLSESTFAGYYPMYGGKENVAPFMTSKLSNALLLKNFYTTGVRSINTLISLLTGLGGYPGYKSLTLINPDINTPALSSLLKTKGYKSALIHGGAFSFYNKLAFLKNRDFDLLADAKYLKQLYPEAKTASWGIDDRYMVKEGLKWIDKKIADNKNFFLTFVPISPHHPYDIPEDIPKYKPNPQNLYDEYLNNLFFVDEIFKMMYKGLEERGLIEDTIIFFLADHGEAFDQHKGNFGHENYIFEENVRIPGIIFNPVIFDNYYELETIANVADIFATTVDIMNLSQPVGSQGESLLKRNVGKMRFFACGEKNVDIGLRDGKYKAILNFNKNKLSLFNIEDNIYDFDDISEIESDIAIKYKKILTNYYEYQKNYLENFDYMISKILVSNNDFEDYKLTDIKPYFSAQDFYSIKVDSDYKGDPIKICGKTYRNGFGVFSNSCMKFDIKGIGFEKFSGIAGKLETDSVRQNFLEMRIYLDGELRFTTGKLTTGNSPLPFEVDVSNASTIELMVMDTGDGHEDDSAAWIEPILTK
jgi:phosphoglycerol transferase MdoB-like AlkP superfamily enzyme